MEQLQEFFNMLPPELQEKITMLEPEEQEQVLMDLMQRYQEGQSQYAQMGAMAGSQKVPVEAEKNENVTVQNGITPEVEGGYLKEISRNPVTGQATYEIPNNRYNNSHGEAGNGSHMTGVNMQLNEGDVVNSDKTKIPTSFIVNNRNFKGKTFKDASDYISKREMEIQKNYKELAEKGKVDKVSEGSVLLMLAKLGSSRNTLNEIQEEVLENKKQREGLKKRGMESGGSTRTGERIPYILDFQMPNYQYDNLSKGMGSPKVPDSVKDRMANTYQAPYPVINAQDGAKATFDKQMNLINMIRADKDLTPEDAMSYAKQAGLTDNSALAFNMINPSKSVGGFKEMIASKESGGSYSAINKQGDKDPGAWGKYQFRWTYFKNPIKKLTGIETPYEFLKNPAAQEKVMDWHIENQLLPQAANLKQKYSLPFTIQQLMAMIHLEGEAGLEKKIKTGNLNSSTYSGKFKNASPSDYAKSFEYGGATYNMTVPGSDYMGGRKDYVLDANYNYGGSIYAKDGVGITPAGINLATVKGYDPIGKLQYVQGIQQKDYPVADYNMWTEFIDSIKDDPEFSEDIKRASDQAKTYKTGKDWEHYARDTKFGKVHKELYPAYAKWVDTHTPPSIRPKFEPDASKISYYEETPSGTQGKLLYEVPYGQYEDKTGLGKFEYPKIEEPVAGEGDIYTEEKKSTTPAETPKKPSWLDRIRYGIDQSLPYLANLRLLREGRIMPTLQQKPYYNPYESMRTDFSIQSALNDIDRGTLTAMADTRGNPSVRNARMAQIYANAQAAKAPLYTQKYNVEQQLKNQKLLGEYDYLNKWTDVNMALRKQYEREVLQTIENQRQQQHMALEKMANDYLRGKESKQALELATMDTDYVWNPYTQKLEIDPEKREANFERLKLLEKFKTSNQSASIPEGYKLVPKYSLEKEEKGKYGSTIKKKKLSLKNYY